MLRSGHNRDQPPARAYGLLVLAVHPPLLFCPSFSCDAKIDEISVRKPRPDAVVRGGITTMSPSVLPNGVHTAWCFAFFPAIWYNIPIEYFDSFY